MSALVLDAPLAVQIHVVTALAAICLTPIQLLRRRRDGLHRATGYLWVCAMAATAISAFWISELRVIGRFSPIHLLSVYVLWSLWVAINAARRGQIDLHRRAMTDTAFWGLGVAGAFTFVPGRLMSRVVFDDFALQGFAVVLALLLVLATLMVVRRRSVRTG